MASKKDRLSVFISLVLRHKPELANITLNSRGYTDVDSLIEGINKTGRYIDLDILKDIVDSDKKGRYKFNEDMTKIRANQGHSLDYINLELESVKPLDILYHGTATKNLDSIMKNGLKKMNRNHVHLSDDLKTASQVGRRHGELVILEVDSKKMYEDGYEFYLSDNKVWLTDAVPVKYIKVK